jgi:intracellular sulfur oxidation DsrE/DsrF family protein
MDRRALFGLLPAAFVAVPAAAKGTENTPHRLVLHIDQNDPALMTMALNNAGHVVDYYQERGEEVAIEIVAYGQGLHMLRDDTSPVKAEIRELRKTMPQLVFGACNNTKTGMEKREGKPVPIIPEATIVPAGVVRLVELQEAGYAYVKP